MFGEPPATQLDLHFRLLGVPIRVHPFFWAVALFLGLGGGPADPTNTLIWVAVVFVSIVVHEMGHAMVQRRFGGHPWITLYGLGGLAACDDCDRSPRNQILISLAGPAAGFLLAALVVVVLAATGHFQSFRLNVMPVDFQPFDPQYWDEHLKPSPRDWVVLALLYVNIFWGLVNLLPIYPLDGGRVAREVMTLGNPRQGIINSLWVSIVTAALVAGYSLVVFRSFFMALFFGFMAYSNYQTLQAYQRHWSGGP